LRWLHCSDFHIGKDRPAQERLVNKIIEHVKDQVAKGFTPDLVFITGDIAQQGLKSEYKDFRTSFLQPLREACGGNNWAGRILAVPGNHDVDRTKNRAFDGAAALAAGSKFFDPGKGGRAERDILAPRFKAFAQGAVADLSAAWLSNGDGAFAEAITIQGAQFGVVGINTAWLAKEHDQLKLTPGVQLVEAALEKVKNCPVSFVLGHHPLNWLDEEHARRLKALFGHHRVIYLHGHMHHADGTREDGAGNDFLVFQAGAAFQARDDDPWRNGLLWGEIDLRSNQIKVSPRYWNPGNYDWPPETGRFPEKLRILGTDWWGYPLPCKEISVENTSNNWSAPVGWEVLSAAEFASLSSEVSAEDAERFFEGAEPDWAIALSPKLPRRAIVDRLVQQITNHRGQEQALVVFLTGPGGEGKSTVLRQTLAVVSDVDKATRILWHTDDSQPLSLGALTNIPEGPWVIATDVADLIAPKLFQTAKELRHIGRFDIKFLLCSRDTDWRAVGAEKLEWSKFTDYRIETMSGVSQDDANLIASAWGQFESNQAESSMAGQLEKGKVLFDATRHGATVSEGSLLGGILAVRYGSGLRAHVARLMERLSGYKLGSGNSLYDAFAYIAVMHAEGLDFLSRSVLAQVLDCNVREFGKQVILPLAKEAAASGGTLIFTRHRLIAKAAVTIMSEEYGEDVTVRFEDLARAAVTARGANIYVPELHRWDYDLPEHFVDKSPETAIRIGRALLDAAPSDVKLAVHLAKIYRKCGDSEAGAKILKSFKEDVAERAFWYEWGTCEGVSGNQAVGAVLDGWSLSDQALSAPPNAPQSKLSLSGLGFALLRLYEDYPDRRFIDGLAATAYLGSRLPIILDATTRGYFKKHKSDADAKGARTNDLAEAISQLQASMSAAWDVSGMPAELATRISSPHSFTFRGLEKLFSYRINTVSRKA
jgi:hypothetical protein